MDFSWITFVLLAFVTILAVYVIYMSWDHAIFRKMGIPGPFPVPVVGNFYQICKRGPYRFQQEMYIKYINNKVYGIHDGKFPTLIVKDLDMIRDITVKHFGNFVNRRVIKVNEPFDHMLTLIVDDHWKNVRSTVSPTFSSGKLRRMFNHVASTSDNLMENLRESQAKGEAIELKEIFSCYTMDVIAGTGFGVQVNSLKDAENEFVARSRSIMSNLFRFFAFTIFFPFMTPKWMDRLGVNIFKKEDGVFFNHFIEEAIERRKEVTDNGRSKRNDFLQILIDAQAEVDADDDNNNDNDNMSDDEARVLKTSSGKKPLSLPDIQGTSIIFLLAGYDTVSTVLSFTFFLLAQYPECCRRVQDELDETLGTGKPTYGNIQELTYMDQCLNEAMRLFPPGFQIDRVCNQDIHIGGVKIPKGMTTQFPVYAIHHDPNLWPNPETFDPERFSPENKASRHPYAHLPFGQGPRNCIGMRLALMEMKMALAAILQEMTPVACPKTVYPVKLKFFQMSAEDGLWVKLEGRKAK